MALAERATSGRGQHVDISPSSVPSHGHTESRAAAPYGAGLFRRMSGGHSTAGIDVRMVWPRSMQHIATIAALQGPSHCRLGHIVRRCSSASRSFVLATLRALHLDLSNASDEIRQDDNAELWLANRRFGSPTRATVPAGMSGATIQQWLNVPARHGIRSDQRGSSSDGRRAVHHCTRIPSAHPLDLLPDPRAVATNTPSPTPVLVATAAATRMRRCSSHDRAATRSMQQVAGSK